MMMLLAVLSGMGLAAYRGTARGRRSGNDLRPGLLDDRAGHRRRPGRLRLRVLVRDITGPPIRDGLGALILAVVNVPNGGLVVYGAFFGGMIGLGLFWWRHRMPLLATADLIAPSMLLGLALGRVGCLLNGCCFGGPCDLPWKVTFPWNSPVHQHEAEEGVAGVFGLKFRDGPDGLPVIERVAPDSPAAREGLSAGMEIAEINGVRVASARSTQRQSCWASTSSTCCFAASGGEVSFGPIDDPPESQTQGSGPLKIYGLEIAGSDDQDGRRQPRPAAIVRGRGRHSRRPAGGKHFRPQGGHDRAASPTPRRASPTSLARHRVRPVVPAADRTGRRSPLAAEPAGPSHAALQHDRRLGSLLPVAGLRSFSPPRRRADGLDDDHLSRSRGS